MTVANENILLKFPHKNTQFGVTRGTVKAMAEELGLNETQVILIALARLASDVLPAYDRDDGPLTAKQIRALRKYADKDLPTGVLVSKEVLFA